jgi:hypothetical protein
MKILTIKNKRDLLQFQSEIDILFFECFGGRPLGELWNWAYIDNPNGEPLVTLCYDENRLVGHYAIMSMPLSLGGNVVNSYLSMTTMVSASHRKYGLFVKLASENYRVASELGVDFIMGFPNAMSAPGFKKRLNWTMPPADYVANTSKEHLLEMDKKIISCAKNAFALNLQDQSTLQWRMSRPGANYVWDDGLLYKEFEGAIDVMYVYSADDLDKLPENKKINILIRGEEIQLRDFIAFEYQFGGVTISKDFDPAIISRQMCLSDVF